MVIYHRHGRQHLGEGKGRGSACQRPHIRTQNAGSHGCSPAVLWCEVPPISARPHGEPSPPQPSSGSAAAKQSVNLGPCRQPWEGLPGRGWGGRCCLGRPLVSRSFLTEDESDRPRASGHREVTGVLLSINRAWLTFGANLHEAIIELETVTHTSALCKNSKQGDSGQNFME